MEGPSIWPFWLLWPSASPAPPPPLWFSWLHHLAHRNPAILPILQFLFLLIPVPSGSHLPQWMWSKQSNTSLKWILEPTVNRFFPVVFKRTSMCARICSNHHYKHVPYLRFFRTLTVCVKLIWTVSSIRLHLQMPNILTILANYYLSVIAFVCV